MSTTIDLSALERMAEMAGGDRSFVVEIIDDYLSDSATLLETLREASGEDLRRAAHTLKSTSASVGAGRLADVCSRLERAGAADADLLAEAEREHADACTELAQQRVAFS